MRVAIGTRALHRRQSRHSARRTLGRGRGDGVRRRHAAHPVQSAHRHRRRGAAGCSPLSTVRLITSRSCRIRASHAAALDASPARTSCLRLRGFDELRGPQRAAIDILPFQLEPALALVRGHASRFLLADEVGLGKTIQAGLMLSELRLRGWCERALIVTPAGLRQQWAEELRQRFEIHATVVDASVARGTRRVAALRRESVVRRTGRHHVHRLSEAARSAARRSSRSRGMC